MSLDDALRQTVEETVRQVLTRELPPQLARVSQAPDPDRLRSIEETAEYLGVTPACVRERLKAGELQAVSLGKYRRIPHKSIQELIARQLDRERFARGQAGNIAPENVDADISAALGLTAPSTPRRRQSKKEGAPSGARLGS